MCYFITFRYNPDIKELTMDSKPNFDKYDEFLMTENRYANLKQINPKDCDKILDNQKNGQYLDIIIIKFKIIGKKINSFFFPFHN